MATFEHNKDGSTTIKLVDAITVGGEESMRATIPALRGKHLMAIPFVAGEVPSLGELVTWAARVVEPVGAIELMSPSDAIDVAGEVASMLGKGRSTGTAPSP